MVRGQRLQTVTECEIIRLRDDEGLTFQKIADELNLIESTVKRAYDRRNQPETPERRGRPRKTDERLVCT